MWHSVVMLPADIFVRYNAMPEMTNIEWTFKNHDLDTVDAEIFNSRQDKILFDILLPLDSVYCRL